MIEILQIIVLACSINVQHTGDSEINRAFNARQSCYQKLISCYEKAKPRLDEDQILKECLLRTKVY
jgi:hypothetical protein